jgi:hypothetical protein
MKIFNRKGSALLQVLVLSAVVSTIVVILLKFAITRTSNTIQTKHIVGAKIAMQSCMSALNEEELRRVTEGRAPYFEENAEFPCAISDYEVTIKRGNDFSHNDGIVRPLEFTIRFFQMNSNMEEENTDNTNP